MTTVTRSQRRPAVDERIAALDWLEIESSLDAHGSAVMASVLTPGECRELAAGYDDDGLFRSRVVMARHGFGSGEYRYYDHPLPPLIADLRVALYERLVGLANRWNESLGIDVRYPDAHTTFLDRCHRAGQTKPTPLLLRYREGDFNCLHQDVYGEHVFPLQVTFLLSTPGEEFTGAEFVLVEQRPRQQSRAEVVTLGQGDGVIFPVQQRPVRGTRGSYRAGMRHGVSRLRSGSRHTLGIIFHDAR
jgi:uncharacterized protein